MINTRKTVINLPVIIIALVVSAVLAGCAKERTQNTADSSQNKKDAEQKVQSKVINKEPNKPAAPVTIDQLVKETGFWRNITKEWRGMSVPDFNLTDINGTRHKLSDYKGKNVLVFEWVVWCPGCKAQIEFLKELRAKVGEEKLVILAVAIKTNKEDLQKVKDFVQKQKINFPVFYELQKSLPEILTINDYVPCNYFIRPDGTIKLGVVEVITIRDLIRVLDAQ
jgi:peroxiredoxin